jgi:aerobic-type carbon monoxide dehydrogenase small subunit (CoxS/CutS family)
VIRELSLNVNGGQRRTTTDEDRPLLDVLREDFQLTGTKFGCGEGECGACELHAVQQAFLDKQAMQCGYCVPGHIMTAVAFARDNPGATREEVLAAMSEHICRCCNYPNILAAVEQAVAAKH